MANQQWFSSSRIAGLEGRFEPQILDARIFQPPRPGIRFHEAAAEVGFDRGGDRRVHGDEVAVKAPDDTIPNQVAAAGFPDQAPVANATAKFGHAQGVNPGFGTRANQFDGVTHFESPCVFEMETGGADRYIIVGDLPRRVGLDGQIVVAGQADQGPAIQARGHEHGAVVVQALPPQDHAGIGDLQAAENFVPPLEQQDRATNAVGVRGQLAT